MNDETYEKILEKLWEIKQLTLDAGCFCRGEGFDETDNFGLFAADALVHWIVLRGELPVEEKNDAEKAD